MAIRGTMDPPQSLSLSAYNCSLYAHSVHELLSLEFKAFALSQNGNSHLGIPQHNFEPYHASILLMG